MADGKEYAIRIVVKDGKQVSAELEQIGADGKKSFNELGTSVLGLNKSLDELIKRAAGVVSITALGEAAHRAFDDVAELADTAERLGLSVEKLQEYRYAAVQAGEAQGTMDEALFHFTEQLGQAQSGTGRFLITLKDYNISLKDGAGNNRNAETVLRSYLDAIKNASTQQERLALATKAFGDDAGRELLPILEKGSAGFDDMGKKAQESGRIIDERYVTAVKNLNQEIKNLADEGWTHFKSLIAGDVYELGNILDKLKVKFSDIESILKAAELYNNGADFNKSFQFFQGQAAGERQLEMFRQASAHAKEKLEADKLSSGLNGGGANDASTQRAEAIAKEIQNLEFRNNLLQEGNEKAEVYSELQKNHVDLSSQEGQKIAELVRQHIELVKEQQLNRSLAKDFSQGLEEAAQHGSHVLDILGKVAEKMITDMLATKVFSPLETAAENMFSNFHFAGGGVMTSAGPLPLRTYSGGGIANSPQMAVFGEGDSPEAYVPVPNGKIPVEMSGGGGKVYIGVNVVNEAGDVVQAQARPSSDGMNVEVMIKRLVDKGISGGDYDRTLKTSFGLTRQTG